MPMSVMQRAETVLLNISSELRSVQTQAYALQESIAKRTEQAYSKQKYVIFGKTGFEAFSLATRAVIATNAIPMIRDLIKVSIKKNPHLKMEDFLSFTSKSTDALTSVAIDPVNISAQANSQKLATGQQELSTLHNSLQTMMQTHDSAIQRLQNMESSNRQAG